MKNPFRKKKSLNPDDMPPLPRLDVINAIQFQLFDNGAKPGRGRSQHQIKMEVYCEGRLNLHKPYWWRVIPLLDQKVFMSWVNKAVADKRITQEQYEMYKLCHEAIVAEAARDDVEFAKLGHIGVKATNTYYPGQFIAAIKEKDGGLRVVVVNGQDAIEADSFLFDKLWVKGGPRRKFFGFYDPYNMYEAAKREKEQIAKAEAQAEARRLGS
jgi:hypothetical protein